MKVLFHITYRDLKHVYGEGECSCITEHILSFLRDSFGRVIYPIESEECNNFTGWICVNNKYLPLILPKQILSYCHLYGYIQGRYFSE